MARTSCSALEIAAGAGDGGGADCGEQAARASASRRVFLIREASVFSAKTSDIRLQNVILSAAKDLLCE
jgi:hypothetical protein